MRKNIIQGGSRAFDGRIFIDEDWFEQGIPGNVKLAEHVYIDTSYGFSPFHSLLPDAMTIGNGSGCYDRASFITGEKARIETGEFNIWNGSTFICNKSITVGSHCMFAWGSVVTDSWINEKHFPVHVRRKMLETATKYPFGLLPVYMEPKPILIEDNVWVGFDAVVLPGVKLGRGCIAGSKSVVTEDVPAYAIVAGNPAKIIRYLDADDTEEARARAMVEYLSPVHAPK